MLNTNICIYAMKNKPEHVLQRLKKELNSGICISSITLAELEYGRVEDLLRGPGLHRFLTNFLARVNHLGTRIGRDFLLPLSA